MTIYPISLPGSTRDPYPDIARANTVWNQCSVAVVATIGQCWNTKLLDQDAPLGALNASVTPAPPSPEESSMLAHRPGSASAIHAYYVPSLIAPGLGSARGKSFWPAAYPSLDPAVVISDSAASDTFAHELGHVLLDDGSHHADPDNLMATGSSRNVGVDQVESTQCAKT